MPVFLALLLTLGFEMMHGLSNDTARSEMLLITLTLRLLGLPG